MIKKLPVPYQGFYEVEFTKPTGGVLAEVHDSVKNNSVWVAMRNFVSGCTSRFIGNDKEIIEKLAIKRMYDKMSNKNLEYISQEIMILYYNKEDYVEGVYPCPRCGKKLISEKKIIDDIEIDSRDRISDLKVNFMDNESQSEFEIMFTEMVEIKTDSGSDIVESITMRMPTVEDHIKAHSSIGDNNVMKFQYSVWANAIIKVNGNEINDSWRRSCGMQLFNNIKESTDIKQISNYINSWGIDPRIEKVCFECGKAWQPFINTFNFFDFAPL